MSWNVRRLLQKCLASIFEFCKEQDYEVIVIDNNSSDGTPAMIEQEYPQVKLTTLPKNLGFASANNIGIRKAQGDYILLLNPDTEFIEDSLSKIGAKMDSDESIGILGCKLLNPDRTAQPSVRRFPRAWDILVMFLKLHKLFPTLLNRYLLNPHPNPLLGSPPAVEAGERELYDVDQVMGAFFCVRKEVFDKIGLLDAKYFIWFEEVDFCRRVKLSGWRVVYSPVTSVIHHGGQSFAQQATLKKQWWFFKSGLRFLRKKYF